MTEEQNHDVGKSNKNKRKVRIVNLENDNLVDVIYIPTIMSAI